jgi:predicted TIM-barrel fold metal-dependent hydrolase
MMGKCKNRIRFIPLAIIGILLAGHVGISCKNSKEEYLTEAEYKKMDKIDIHCHLNTKRPAFMEQAADDNFRILTINTDAPIGVTIQEQEDIALYQIQKYPDRLAYLTTFSIEGWDEKNWQDKTIARLNESFEMGAIGVKVWKNIGMVEQDQDGRFIMIDDPKFDLVFSYLEEKGIPVCGHLGEPRNCWLPLDEMTVNNDKTYFKEHPEYHMYLHPEYPSYEEQIAARDRMLEKHPDLIFMGAHLGSLEWSVDKMAMHFERFPNSTMDLAERICHIQVQAQEDWEKVRDFFIRYQDRILYGTDRGDYEGAEANPQKLKENVHEVWKSDWKFFTTDETMTSWKVDGEFKGLKLPKKVIEKIYFKNAERVFPEFKNLKN